MYLVKFQEDENYVYSYLNNIFQENELNHPNNKKTIIKASNELYSIIANLNIYDIKSETTMEVTN